MSIDQDSVKQLYGKAQQTFFKDNIALSLANREPGDALRVEGGRKYHKAILGGAEMQKYTPLTATDGPSVVETEDESLVVDRNTHAESVHKDIDDTEKSQLTNYQLVEHYGEDLGKAMKDSVEKRWTSNIEGVHEVGSIASPIDYSNQSDLLDAMEESLGLVDASDAGNVERVLLTGPRGYRAIERAAVGRTTGLGDTVFVNGYPASRFMDAMVIKSNNLPWSAKLKLASNPTAGDTITIASTKITFVSALTSGGNNEVKIESGKAGTQSNLQGYIRGETTGGQGAGTTYNPPTLTQRRFMRRNYRITMEDFGDTTSDVAEFKGFGDISTKADLTAAPTDGWSDEYTKNFVTVVGATDLALQLDGGVEMSRPKPVSGEAHFTRLSGVVLHNSKTFTDGRYVTVENFVDASSY